MVVTTSFRVPEEVQRPLKRASQLFGDLMDYIDNLAGAKAEDLRSVVILRTAEVYGVVQLAGVLFGSQCQESLPKAIKTYSLMVEKVLDWLYSGADYKAGLELLGLIFKYEVGIYLLLAGCAGIGAIVPYYEEGGGSDN